MKRILAVAAVAALAAASASVAPASAAQRVTVPGRTAIRLVSDTVVSSLVAVNPGDELDFHVASPVVVDGWVVIPADAKAVGHFISGGGVEVHQRLFGADVHPRQVVFALDYVVSADGGKIRLNGANMSPPVTNQVEAHTFFHQKSAAGVGLLNKGTVIGASIDHTVHVVAEHRSGPAAGGFDQ